MSVATFFHGSTFVRTASRLACVPDAPKLHTANNSYLWTHGQEERGRDLLDVARSLATVKRF